MPDKLTLDRMQSVDSLFSCLVNLEGNSPFMVVRQACLEIVECRKTGIWPPGVTRRFQSLLLEAGYPQSSALRIAEDHLRNWAVQFVADSKF